MIASPATSPQPTWLRGPILWLLLVGASLAIYWPALSGEYLWDDRPGHVTRPELQSVEGLRRIWTELGATQQYYPVLHTAFWLEHRVWGDAPAGYHLLNVLLHATGAVLFAGLLYRWNIPGAALAAALWALHPVAVESVAWISEQKNTLSTVFYLGAALVYTRFMTDRRRRDYVIATILFLFALGTKTVTATLPAALLVLTWWRQGRLAWREHVRPLLPWFALALGAGLFTAWIESALIGAQGAEFQRDVLERSLLPGHVIWFYLGKLFWPANLAFIYPRWVIRSDELLAYVPGLAAVLALTALWWLRRRLRAPLAVALLFVGTLFPVLGLLNVYPFRYSFVADHFQYLAALAVSAGMAEWIARHRALRWPAGLILVACGVLSHTQSAFYRDPLTLYTATVARNPTSWMAHNNLAEVLAAAGRPAEAIPHLERALQLKPDSAEAENNLGDDLRRVGRAADALPHLQRALSLRPAYPEARNNLGAALATLGRHAEAETEFTAALRLRPAFPLAHFNLGLSFAQRGNVAAAEKHFARAVALQPDYAEAELNLAIAVLLSRGFAPAESHFRRALALAPDSADAHLSYGRALLAEGQLDAAIATLRRAVEFRPISGEAHRQLALALRQRGDAAEAAREWAEANRLGPSR